MSPYDSTHPSRPALARKRTSERGPTELPAIGPESPSESQDGKGKTRARINMACIHCRHRKIKCDGTQPACATCVRLRRECEYEPVTEYENLMSRERKRRNKEKKATRMASLGIFAGQSPLSMLHPATSLGLPSTPLTHYGDLSQPNLTPLFLSTPDPRSEAQPVESQFGPRRRRGISDTQATTMHNRLGPLTSPLPGTAFQHASVSQPPTPAQAYRYYQSLAVSPMQPNVSASDPHDFFIGPMSAPLMPPASAGSFFSPGQPLTPVAQPQQMMASPQIVDLIGLSSSSLPAVPSGCASATEADFDLGMVDMTGLPTVVPTSAHVRPIDLPAPHGHFDFASIPFPTQDTFSLELPIASLRRRSSIHLPVGTADAFRRPSVAEVATAALMHRVAVKRAEKIDTDIKQLADDLLTPDSSGIVAWNAHVQSQLPASMASWSGFHPSADFAPSQPASTSDYVPLTMSASRSNSLRSLGPLSPPNQLTADVVKTETEEVSATSSCSVSSAASHPAEVPLLDQPYFTSLANTKVSREMSPFTLSPALGNSSTGNQSSLVAHGSWSTTLPLLSPVSELNNTFHGFNVFQSSASQMKAEDDSTMAGMDSNSLSMAFSSNF